MDSERGRAVIDGNARRLLRRLAASLPVHLARTRFEL
jgi:hypothetical protein